MISVYTWATLWCFDSDNAHRKPSFYHLSKATYDMCCTFWQIRFARNEEQIWRSVSINNIRLVGNSNLYWGTNKNVWNLKIFFLWDFLVNIWKHTCSVHDIKFRKWLRARFIYFCIFVREHHNIICTFCTLYNAVHSPQFVLHRTHATERLIICCPKNFVYFWSETHRTWTRYIKEYFLNTFFR